MGSGRVGSTLASFLISDGHDVTIIEKDEKRCHVIAPNLDANVICGKGTNKETLEDVNLDNASVFVAAS